MSSDSMDQPRNPCEVGGELGVRRGGAEWEFVQGNSDFSKVWGVQFKQRGWFCGIVLICINACFLKICKSF